MSEKWNAYWKAFVPQKISGAWVAGSMQLGAVFTYLSKRKKEMHKEENTAVITAQAAKLFVGKYIEKQHDWSCVYFGVGKDNTIAHSGCGIIATYNVMAFLEKWVEPQIGRVVDLIGYFEERGAVLGGRFGVAPKAIVRCLKSNGYQVKYLKSKVCTTEEELNAIGETYQTVMVTFFNHEKDITKQMHTVCITKEQGRYFAHNAVSFAHNAPCGAKTFADAVKFSATAPKVICAIGIF